MDFLKNNGAVRATRSGGIPDERKREWLADYEKMLASGHNLARQELTEPEKRSLRVQIARWKSDLESKGE